jgi:hypothetical protein
VLREYKEYETYENANAEGWPEYFHC